MKYRSQYEQRIARQLEERGCKFVYEPEAWTWHYRVPRAWCDECQSTAVMKARTYTPDFYLPSVDLYIEAKGRLDADDRTTLIGACSQHPEKRLYLLFQRDNWMTKLRHRRYSGWAEANNFTYAIGERIPDKWLRSAKK